MTLSCVRSHCHQTAVRLEALAAVLQDLTNGSIDPAVLEGALTDLAAVEQRLEELADRLGGAYDPAARGRGTSGVTTAIS
jgi:hypothetical protein